MSNCKYYKQKKQISYDSGQTWSDVSPAEYQVGGLYQIDSQDCSEIGIIRWVIVPGDYLCDGKDKYQKEIEQYTIDGVVWRNMYPTTYRKGNLIESNSSLCDNKWEGHYIDETDYTPSTLCPKWYKWVDGVGCVYVDPIKFVRCSTSSSTTLTSDDVNYNPYKLIYGAIGDCVTSIGTSAFNGCTSLTSVSIGSGVTSIGSYAFGNCVSLSNIIIPDSVITIYGSAFDNCTGLTSCTIGSGVTSIGYGAFRYCTGLTSIVIPDSVTSLDSDIFQSCYGLTSCTIGSGVTRLSGTFAYCSNLRIVTCLATTPPTQDIAFLACPLEHIYVPCDSLTYYLTAWSSYANVIEGIPPCNTPLQYKLQATYSDSTSYNLLCDSSSGITSGDTRPNGYTASAMTSAIIDGCTNITTIGDRAFSGFTSLSSVTIPDSITRIGEYTFAKCQSLLNIDIPDATTIINDWAFLICTGLTTVTIGSGITNITSFAFQGCSSLSQLTIKATTPPTLGTMALYDTSNDLVIYVPSGSVETYKAASGWSSYASRIQPIPT